MAGTNLGNANVNFTSNTSTFQAGLKRAAGATNKFKASLSGLPDRIKASERGIRGVGVASAAMATALAGVGIAAVRVGAQFEKSLVRAGALAGATSVELQMMSKSAREGAQATIFTASKAAEALGFMSMAGFTAAESSAALRDVLDLAAAAQIDLGRASDLTTNIMGAFGKEVGDLAKVNDVLVNTITSSNVNMEQMGEAIKFVGPIANSAGQSLETMSAAIGLLGNVGIQGSLAGTSLRAALARLLKPSEDVTGALTQLGLSMDDVNPSTNDFIDIVRKLKGAFGNLKDPSKTAALQLKLFGKIAGPGMAALLSTSFDKLDDMEQKIAQTGKTADIVARQMDTLSGKWDLSKSKAQELALAISDHLEPSTKDFVDTLNSALDGLTGLGRGAKRSAIEAGVLAAGVATVTAGLSTLALVLPSLAAGFKIMWAGATGPIGAVIAGIASVALFIRNVNDEMSKAIGMLNTALVAMKAVSKIAPGGAVFTNIIDAAIGANGLGGGTSGVDSAFDSAMDSGDAFAKSLDELDAEIAKFKPAVSDAEIAMKQFMDQLKKTESIDAKTKAETRAAKQINKLADAAEKASKTVKVPLAAPGGIKPIDTSQIKADIAKEKAAEKVEKDVGKVLSSSVVSASQKLGSFGDVAQTAAKGFAAGGPFGAIIAAIIELLTMTEGFKQVVSSLSKITDASVESLGSIVGGVFGAFSEVFSAFSRSIKALKPAMDILGVSLELFVRSITSVIVPVLDFVSGVIRDIFEGIAEVWNGMLGGLADIFDFIGNISVLGKRIFGKMNDWADDIRGAMLDTDNLFGDDNAAATDDGPAVCTSKPSADICEAAENMADAMDEVTESFKNVPEGFKVATARFDSIIAGLGGEGMQGATAAQTGESMFGAARGATTIENVNINGSDAAEIWRELRRQMEWDNFVKDGTTVGQASPFALPATGGAGQ
jgi:TP901 family phage tail tape measure protein